MADDVDVKKSAGAFDIRIFIGGMLGFFGVVITIMGLWFTTDADKAKADGENLNLQVGIILIVVAALFVVWAVLRPIKVPEHIEDINDERPAH